MGKRRNKVVDGGSGMGRDKTPKILKCVGVPVNYHSKRGTLSDKCTPKAVLSHGASICDPWCAGASLLRGIPLDHACLV